MNTSVLLEYTYFKRHLKPNTNEMMSGDFTTHENHSCYCDYHPSQRPSFLALAASRNETDVMFNHA